MTVLLCSALVGCVGDDGPAVFAGRDNSSALLVQWTDDGNGKLAGSVQIANKSASANGAPVKQLTLTFTGKLESERVSLVVKQDLGGSQTWTGTLDGDELQVNVPEGAGSVETLTLARASAATYNADVADLEAAVVKARGEAARAAAVAEREAAIEDAEAAARQTFLDAVSAVSTSQETMLALMTDPPELKALGQDLKAARSNLARVRSAADEAAIRSRGFVACEFASQAAAAADDVDGEALFLKRHARAVAETADDLAEAREEFSRAYARLRQLAERDGQSSRSGSAAQVSLTDKARRIALSWRSAVRRATKEMTSIVAQADSAVGNVVRASC